MDSIDSFTASIGGGFLGGILLGYAMKKVIRIASLLVGLFLAGLAFLQYQQISSINWDKIEGSITGLTSATVNILSENSIAPLMLSNFGIPLTSSAASGFTVGFLKG